MELLLLERPDLQLLRQRTAEEYAGEESTLLTWRQLSGAELPKLLQRQSRALTGAGPSNWETSGASWPKGSSSTAR